MFCPECGKPVAELLSNGQGIIVSDPNASLRYDPTANADTNVRNTIEAYERTPAVKPPPPAIPRRTAGKRMRERRAEK